MCWYDNGGNIDVDGDHVEGNNEDDKCALTCWMELARINRSNSVRWFSYYMHFRIPSVEKSMMSVNVKTNIFSTRMVSGGAATSGDEGQRTFPLRKARWAFKLVKILAVKNKMLKQIFSPSEESEYYGIPLQQVNINVNICKVTSGSSFQYKYWFGQNNILLILFKCSIVAQIPNTQIRKGS